MSAVRRRWSEARRWRVRRVIWAETQTLVDHRADVNAEPIAGPLPDWIDPLVASVPSGPVHGVDRPIDVERNRAGK